MLPLSLLKAAIDHPMLIELKNGDTYNGRLVSCNVYMNICLKDVICTSKDGERFWKLPECYIRGNSIKYLRIPDDIIDTGNCSKLLALFMEAVEEDWVVAMRVGVEKVGEERVAEVVDAVEEVETVEVEEKVEVEETVGVEEEDDSKIVVAEAVDIEEGEEEGVVAVECNVLTLRLRTCCVCDLTDLLGDMVIANSEALN
eukprot:gene262-281_t